MPGDKPEEIAEVWARSPGARPSAAIIHTLFAIYPLVATVAFSFYNLPAAGVSVDQHALAFVRLTKFWSLLGDPA